MTALLTEPIAPTEPTEPTVTTAPSTSIEPLTRTELRALALSDACDAGPECWLVPSVLVPSAAQLLDDVRPGWFTLVRPDELLMHDPWSCVLGQLYGRYGDGIDALRDALVARGRNLTVLAAFNSCASAAVWRDEVRRRAVAAEAAGTRVTG